MRKIAEVMRKVAEVMWRLCIFQSVFFPKCLYPKCIFAKCARLACLLSFASLFEFLAQEICLCMFWLAEHFIKE